MAAELHTQSWYYIVSADKCLNLIMDTYYLHFAYLLKWAQSIWNVTE